MQLSIVVPVYNSAECLPELARRVLDDVGRYFHTYELILVNDASPDASWETIERLTREHEFVVGVNLRRNVGQDNAIMAGLHEARGDVVVIMDDDLQHDPADIAALHHQIEKGFDVVYAQFGHKRQAWWKNLGSRLADRVAVQVLGKPRHIYMSPYKAIRREVVKEVIRYGGPFTYVDGLIFTVTSNIAQIAVDHHRRFAGRSNYNLVKSVAVWLKLVTSFSVFPLRIVTVVGGIISLFSLAMAAYFFVEALVTREPPGWPSLIVSVFFLGGIQLMGIGAVGEYIGRIFITQNNRPQFTVKDVRRRVRGQGQKAPTPGPASPTDGVG